MKTMEAVERRAAKLWAELALQELGPPIRESMFETMPPSVRAEFLALAALPSKDT